MASTPRTAHLPPLPANAIAAVAGATNCACLGAALDGLRSAAAAAGPGGAGREDSDSDSDTDVDSSDMTADLLGSGLPGLELALASYKDEDEGEASSFFGAGGLLPFVVAAARLDAALEVPLLVAGGAPANLEATGSSSSARSSGGRDANESEPPPPPPPPVALTAEVSVPRRGCETLLARAFLCALPRLGGGCGRVSCATLLACPPTAAIGTAAEKLKCFLGYFESRREAEAEAAAADADAVRFVRAAVTRDEVGGTGVGGQSRWWATASALRMCHVEFEWGPGLEMQEARDCAAVVDFANEQFGYGVIPSATQEEMLVMARPEALVGCAISPAMAPNEAIVVSGARHLIHCTKPTGEAPFKYMGRAAAEGAAPAVIVGVDASKALLDLAFELSAETLARDCNKLMAGFVTARRLLPAGDVNVGRVVTGAWGCGAFGCDVGVKFIQQVLAASIAGFPRLSYFVYGVESAEEYACDHGELEDLFRHLHANSCTVGDLWDILSSLRAPPAADADAGLSCTRRARRWRVEDASELSVLSERERRADEARAAVEASVSQPCGGGCGFALPLRHPTGVCGICAKKL